MRNPEHTYAAFLELHDEYSRNARRLIRSYAEGNRDHKKARDVFEASEQIIFIFARAAQRQIR